MDFLFDAIRNFGDDIIGAGVSTIPGVGPFLAPIAKNLTGNLLNGGRSGGSGDAAAMAMGSNNQLLNYLLGYETPGSKFLEDYTGRVFFDAMEDYSDNDLAKDFYGNISDAVQAGNLDPFSAQQYMASKLSPTSEFYGTDDFADLLNAKVGKDTQKNLVTDAFATNYFRSPSKKESKYYRNLADSLGMNKSPMQFNSFMNNRLANSLEGERKGPLNMYEQRAAAYYGTPMRDRDGNKTGGYNVFGYPLVYNDSSKLIA